MKELDLRQMGYILWRNVLWIAICAMLLGIGGYFLANHNFVPLYSATAKLYVYNEMKDRVETSSASDMNAAKRLVSTYLVVLKSDTVLEEVIKTQHLGYTADQIRNMMEAEPIDETEAFAVTIRNKDPQQARRIVNAIADRAMPEIIRVVKAGSVEVIDYAKLPTVPSQAPEKTYIAIGMATGAACAAAFVLLKALLDTRVHGEEDLERAFTLPVLGCVPTLYLHGDAENGKGGGSYGKVVDAKK